MKKNLLFSLIYLTLWLIFYFFQSGSIALPYVIFLVVICFTIFIVSLIVGVIGSNALQSGQKGRLSITFKAQFLFGSLFALYWLNNQYGLYKDNQRREATTNECEMSNALFLGVTVDTLRNQYNTHFNKKAPVLRAYYRLQRTVNENADLDTDTIVCLQDAIFQNIDTTIGKTRFSRQAKFIYNLERKNKQYIALYYCDSSSCIELYNLETKIAREKVTDFQKERTRMAEGVRVNN